MRTLFLQGPYITDSSSSSLTTNSRPVCSGIRSHCGICYQFFSLSMEIIFRCLFVCLYGSPTLMRGHVCNLLIQVLPGLACAVTVGSKSHNTCGPYLTVSFETGFLFCHLLRLTGFSGCIPNRLHFGCWVVHLKVWDKFILSCPKKHKNSPSVFSGEPVAFSAFRLFLYISIQNWCRYCQIINKQTPWPLVRKRTIPTKLPPLVGET
jgi:hypothetical protein